MINLGGTSYRDFLALNSILESYVHLWSTFLPPPELTELPEKYEGRRHFTSEGFKGGRSFSSRFLRYRKFSSFYSFLFISCFEVIWWQSVLLSRSNVQSNHTLSVRVTEEKKVQTSSLTSHFSQNYLFQVIFLRLDNVLVHLTFTYICGWFMSWLLYLLNVWSSFSTGPQKADLTSCSTVYRQCFILHRVQYMGS